jgi:hypothetical protein
MSRIVVGSGHPDYRRPPMVYESEIWLVIAVVGAILITLLYPLVVVNRWLLRLFLLLCRGNLIALTALGGGYRVRVREPVIEFTYISTQSHPVTGIAETREYHTCSASCPLFFETIDCCHGVITGFM